MKGSELRWSEKEKPNLKYLIVGTGGIGGCIAGYLAHAGYDVTAIARGEHLAAMREHGLRVKGSRMGEDVTVTNLKMMTTEEYQDRADVIFVCTKYYSIDGLIPFLQEASGKGSLIIPILNVVCTGEKLQEKLKGRTVLSGTIYLPAYISAPGEVTQMTWTCKVVYGDRDKSARPEKLERVAKELRAAGMDVEVAEDIGKAAFEKFMFVSPYAATGAFLKVEAREFQKPGSTREFYIALLKEVVAISQALGYDYGRDMVQEKKDYLKKLNPDSTASMVKDLQKGGESEIDGLVFEVVRMGHRLGVPVPRYEMVSKAFGFVDE